MLDTDRIPEHPLVLVSGVTTVTPAAADPRRPQTGAVDDLSIIHHPAAPASPPPPAVRPARARFRADIQGLRALAVTMVLLYHAGVPFARGGFAGVDVFFVISGFLITSLIVREVERTGRLSLPGFWARRAKRLLPATAVVLLAVTVLSVFLLPQLRWTVTAGDIVASALYLVNWRLAGQSLDYLAEDYPASPVQHFWSLAVEEQFYLLWPPLVALMALLARRYGWRLRRTLAIALVVLAGASLTWSVLISSGSGSAYFVTTTRIWELAAGAGLALPGGRWALARISRKVAAGLGALGVATLLAVLLLLPDTVAWPGAWALLPTLATAAIIASGPAAGHSGVGRVLGLAPLRRIGDLSYSLYLWHWPLIVLATARWGKPNPITGLAVVLFSIVPAYLTYRFVERPLQRSPKLAGSPRRALAVGAACTAVGVGAGLVLPVMLPDPPVVAVDQRPGALALLQNPLTAVPSREATSITPDPIRARADLPDLYGRGCQSDYAAAAPKPCVFGDPAAPVTVALVGDSRAAQWSPAVQEVARRQDWRLVTITKSGCPLAAVEIDKGVAGSKRGYAACTRWNSDVMKLLSSGPYRPQLVITTSYSPYVAGVDGHPLPVAASRKALIKGFRTAWSGLNAIGIPVVALGETPLMGQDVAECVSAHRDDLDQCATPRSQALGAANVMAPAAMGLSGSTVLDLTQRAICPAQRCPAVIGNVLIYRDQHHLTATYARSLAPFLVSGLMGLRRSNFDGGALSAVLP